MKLLTRTTCVLILFMTATAAYSQDVHYNYDRGANFAPYKT